MSVDEKKTIPQEPIGPEAEAALAEETTGLDPAKAHEIREKVRKRIREEVEREIRLRNA